MVKTNAGEVIFDPSLSYTRQSHSAASSSGWRQFMSPSLSKMYQQPISRSSMEDSDSEDDEMKPMNKRTIMKEIKQLVATNMTWKDRKKMENEDIVHLGGKAKKKHRTPLSVAIPAMKNQKKRELKEKEELLQCGRYTKRTDEDKLQRRKPEDRVLKATEGHFSGGVLNVGHLLKPKPSKGDHSEPMLIGKKGKGKTKGKAKKKGKGKKGKRNRH